MRPLEVLLLTINGHSNFQQIFQTHLSHFVALKLHQGLQAVLQTKEQQIQMVIGHQVELLTPQQSVLGLNMPSFVPIIFHQIKYLSLCRLQLCLRQFPVRSLFHQIPPTTASTPKVNIQTISLSIPFKAVATYPVKKFSGLQPEMVFQPEKSTTTTTKI